MINVRQEIVALLKASTVVTNAINVESTRIDKVKQDDCPALSVFNVSTNRDLTGHSLEFRDNMTVGIVILVAKTDTFANDLDTLVDLIIQTIYSDLTWINKFEEISDLQISYDYDQAGETNIAQARILITVQYRDEYPEVILDDFNKIHLDSDISLQDGVIDSSIDVDIQII